ncbi:ABC transporter permease [Staphylococcus succinus]|uniref:ABC transporter permease n=1 Tax=Staphylococcus TaxID=1279 RepID=UPI00062BC9F3|nr:MULTISPECIES: ABC transporter permease [Staphylococcus]MDH9160732.1 ABC transporter permease [Staphylococcus succinus]MEB8123562.1 ABC transporter permease [Staphylococcus succinus]OIJ31150.1 bacitracin ABC transporter permease [Staphylococcus sp. LCT-H4]PNZ23495.1 ABC transporter permease [Staphylococcus succinus subsp. succinus]
MNFNQIVLKNFTKNIRHYAMFIFSLIVSIVLFFSFVTLKYTNSINNENSMKVIQKGSEIGANFLFFIIVVFLLYASHLFIKRRTREFALYQLIGLTRKNIIRMLFIEQFIMFFITGIIGMVIGVFGSKILLMIVLKVLDINTSVSLSFQFPAILQTFILLMVSFILILIQGYLFLRKRSILDMINDNSKSEATKPKITIIEVILGVLGIIMIGFGYYMSTEMFGEFARIVMFVPFIILALTVIGAYLFFRSSVSLIFKTLKRSKHGNVSVTDVVFTSSIMHKMKKNALSLTIIAIISAVTVTVLCFGAVSRSMIDDTVNQSSPQDFNFIKAKQAEQFEDKLEQAHIRYTPVYKELSEVKVLKDDFFKKSMNYNATDRIFITSNKYFNDKDIVGNHAKMVNFATSSSLLKYNLNKDIEIKGETKESFKVIDVNKEVDFKNEVSYSAPVLLVSADKYDQLKKYSTEIHKQYGYNLMNSADWSKVNKLAKSVDPNIQSQKVVRQDFNDSMGILLFVTSFLGLAFLVAAGCIIYIKQMDETEDEMPNFRILRKIGYTHQDMLKGLALKILFNFGLPLIISLLHAYFAAKAFMVLMGATNMLPVYIVMVIYSVIYFIFAIMSFIHSSRIVKHSI